MSTNDPIEERRAANLRRAAAQFEEQRRAPPGHPTTSANTGNASMRAISFTIGRSNGVDDGRGLAHKGIDPRLVSEETIQAVAADEAARQGLDAVAYAEGYGTGLVQIGDALATQHPTGRGACDPEEAPCSGCAAAYSEPDARDIEEDETT